MRQYQVLSICCKGGPSRDRTQPQFRFFFFFPEFLGSTFLELFDHDELLPQLPRLVRAGDENAMMQAVAQQPVAVAIDGDDRVFLGAFQGPRW